MAVNDIYELTNVFTYQPSGEVFIFTFHYRMTAYVSAQSENANCVEIASDIFAQTNNLYNQLIVTDAFALQRVECFVVNKPQFFGNSVQAPVSGGVVGELVPLQSSPIWNKLTELRGRRFRGRNFLLPLPEGEQDAGSMTTNAQNVLQAYGNAILERNVASGDQYKLTVYSATASDPDNNVYIDNIVQTIPVNPKLKVRRTRGNTS